MKSFAVFAVVVTVACMTTGCATQPNYTYQLDTKQVAKSENQARQRDTVGHVVWVNPPMQKVAMQTTKP